MKRVSLCMVAAFTAFTAPLPATASPNIQTYGKAFKIGVVDGQTLSPIQRSGLREFRGMRAYFGAMYVSEDGQAYQHFVNWHDLEKVKVAAKKGCELISEGSPCVLAAVSVPKEVDVDARDASGLGSWALRDLGKYHSRQVSGTYGAFAISGSAHQGYSHGWPNMAEARAAALTFCKAAVTRDFAYIGIEGRKFGRTKGYDKCHIIDESAAQ